MRGAIILIIGLSFHDPPPNSITELIDGEQRHTQERLRNRFDIVVEEVVGECAHLQWHFSILAYATFVIIG
jgi:hypothetical protein